MDYRKLADKIGLIKRVLHLRRKGLSFTKIAQDVGVSDKTVAHKIYKANKDYIELEYINGQDPVACGGKDL